MEGCEQRTPPTLAAVVRRWRDGVERLGMGLRQRSQWWDRGFGAEGVGV